VPLRDFLEVFNLKVGSFSKLSCIISCLFLFVLIVYLSFVFALKRLETRLRLAHTFFTELSSVNIIASIRGKCITWQGAAHKQRWENTARRRLLGLGVQGSLGLDSAR